MVSNPMFGLYGLLIWLMSALVIATLAFIVIRGAVLSALRKHAEEQRSPQEPPAPSPPSDE